MNLLTELREEASHIADSKAVEILISAIRFVESNGNRSRFELLRKRLTKPANNTELAYCSALGKYVMYKIDLTRARKKWDLGGRTLRARTQMEYWRGVMTRIENGEIHES